MFVTFDILAEKLSQYTGYKYVVPTDCCTHAIELCLLDCGNNTVVPAAAVYYHTHPIPQIG